ncbi:hypothetical protein [Streptomyces sp. NPDC127066]|uniref:hypothetical protein n=1 Tax=Streptomyces sp. NPDC127066 TaxID=3347125 RepID=UPI003649105E
MPPGANAIELADILGHDIRIGCRNTGPGLGFGGGCLPRDLRGFITVVEKVASTRPPVFEVRDLVQSGCEHGVLFAAVASPFRLRRVRLVELHLNSPQMRGLHGGATLEIEDRHCLPSAPMRERGRHGNDTSRWL